jgi:hypothetical protein
VRLAALIEESAELTLYQPPELDIVSYFPAMEPLSLSRIDEVCGRMLHEGMYADDDPVFLSTLRVTADAMAARHPTVARDTDGGRILRSVLMKPEHEAYVDRLHERVRGLTLR